MNALVFWSIVIATDPNPTHSFCFNYSSDLIAFTDKLYVAVLAAKDDRFEDLSKSS
jgi:type IV secretory pathway TraG/TraD family ATPase VirD4